MLRGSIDNIPSIAVDSPSDEAMPAGDDGSNTGNYRPTCDCRFVTAIVLVADDDDDDDDNDDSGDLTLTNASPR